MIIDNRENEKVLKILDKLKIPYTREQLPVGDFLDREKGLVVERKTISDFLGSYISNHMSDQCMQMENNFDEYFVFISGCFKDLFFQKGLPDQIKRLTADSYGKMKIHLLRSFSGLRILEFPNDTQLVKAVAELFTYEGSKRIGTLIRLKANKNDIYLNQICSVPGVGIEKAKVILEYVKTPFTLYQTTETELKSLEGIGEIYAKRIKEYFREE